MQKTFTLLTLLCLCDPAIFCRSLPQKNNASGKQNVNKKSIDVVKEKEADFLILNLFKQKKLTVNDIPQQMMPEFKLKRQALICELQKISTQKIDTKAYITKSANIAVDFFETFAQRLEFIKIADWGQRLLAAVKEHRTQNPPETNCSCITVNADNQKLLKNMPE